MYDLDSTFIRRMLKLSPDGDGAGGDAGGAAAKAGEGNVGAKGGEGDKKNDSSSESTSLLGQANTDTGDKGKKDGEGDKGKGEEGKDGKGEKPKDGAPESYADFKLPDGLKMDADMLGQFTTVAKELNLSQEAAQKLVDVHAKDMLSFAQQQEAALTTQRQAWREEVNKLPDAKTQLSLAKKALDYGGDSDFAKLVQTSWLGDHPKVIAYLAKVGKLLSEDRLHGGNGGGSTGSRPIQDVMYGGSKN